MIRKAFRMSVYRDARRTTRRGTRRSRPELERTLAAHGVRHYSIFIDAVTGDLFAYAEVDDEQQRDAIAATDVCRRWWSSMRDVMPSNADSSPVSRPLREVFRMDAA